MPLFVLSFLVSIAFLPGALDPVTVPRWAVIAVGAPFLLFLARAPDGPLRGIGLATVLVIGATLAWTPDLMAGFYDFAHLVLLALVFCVGAVARSTTPAWVGLVAGVSVSALIAGAQLAGWDGLPQAVIPGGLFMNKNLLAEAGAVALVAALAEGWYIAALAPAAVVLMGQSRGVIIALIATAAVALWSRKRSAALALAGLLAGLLGWAFYAKGTSVGIRFDAWANAIEGMRFAGRGIGSFAGNFPVTEFAHNEPLQMLYELGVFALLPVGILAYVWMEETHETEHLVLAVVIAISIFAFPLHMPVTGFAAALAAGHLAAVRHRLRLRDADVGIEGAQASERGIDRSRDLPGEAGPGDRVLPAGAPAAALAAVGARQVHPLITSGA